MIGTFTLSGLARELGGEMRGGDVRFGRISTDTRTLRPGDAFVALAGRRFDGARFVDAAFAAGACAAIASRIPPGRPGLRVPDALGALAALAGACRRRGAAAVIALTGSQGKTTVKEMIGAILGGRAPTLATRANRNNTVGVPLTLLELEEAHRFAVIEMGANRPGEIAFSAAAARPDIALITNARAAHIEGFGGLEGVVEAKGEIIDGAPEDGAVILNAEDPAAARWTARAGGRAVALFADGDRRAAYHARDVDAGGRGGVRFTLVTPAGDRPVELALPGRHNVANAAAAAAAAMTAGAELEDVARGLAELAPVGGRLCPRPGLRGSRVIDDTYNASPASFDAAIEVLAGLPGTRILVAGDMLELGPDAPALHRAMGRRAARAGIDALWSVGALAALAAGAFGDGGRRFEDKDALVAACEAAAGPDAVFLVKGSRGARMEEVAGRLGGGTGRC